MLLRAAAFGAPGKKRSAPCMIVLLIMRSLSSLLSFIPSASIATPSSLCPLNRTKLTSCAPLLLLLPPTPGHQPPTSPATNQTRSPAHLAHALNSTAMRAAWHGMAAAAWANQAVHSRTTHDHIYGRAPLDVQGPGAEGRFAEHVFASALWQELALGIEPPPVAARHGVPHIADGAHHGLDNGPHQQQKMAAPADPSQRVLRRWPLLGPDERLAAMDRPDVLCGRGWRPDQREAAMAMVDAAARGQHAMVVLPCGAGKSLALQRACAVARQCWLVITPTVASRQQWLTGDDEHRAQPAHHASRIAVADWAALAHRMDVAGMLVVATPEDMVRPRVAAALRSSCAAAFAMVAMDEAHLWTCWAGFRPKLATAMDMVRALGRHHQGVPVIGLTGTLPVGQQHAVCNSLAMDDGRPVHLFRRPCTRRDVTLRAQRVPADGIGPWLAAACAHMAIGQPQGATQRPRLGLVFVRTIAGVADMVQELAQHGVAAEGFHGQMEETRKRQVLQRWADRGQPCSVVVATVALAVAVHHSGVVLVVDVAPNYGDMPSEEDVLMLAQKMGRLARVHGDEQQGPHVSHKS